MQVKWDCYRYASADDSEHCHDDDDAASIVSADSSIPLHIGKKTVWKIITGKLNYHGYIIDFVLLMLAGHAEVYIYIR